MAKTTTTNAEMEALKTLLAEKERELSALKAKAQKAVYLKVSEKGAISLYGLGRFPVTLYASQWETVVGMSDDIKAFILDNVNKLARKEGQ